MSSPHPPPLRTVGQRLDLPILSWAPQWWSTLERFSDAADAELTCEPYEADGPSWMGCPPQHRYPLATLPGDVLSEVRDLAAAIWHMDLPDEGLAFLSGMTSLTGPTSGKLFAVLAQCLQEQFHPTAAVKVPLRRPRRDDGILPLHADLVRQRLGINVYERPPAGEGESLFAPAAAVLDTIRPILPAENIAWLERALRGDHWTFADISLIDMMMRPLDLHDRIEAALEPITMRAALGPGEGYLIDDHRWFHGRGYLSDERATWARMQRLSLDIAQTFAERGPSLALPELTDDIIEFTIAAEGYDPRELNAAVVDYSSHPSVAQPTQ